MIAFKVYFEALSNPSIVKAFSNPRIEKNLTLTPNERAVDKSITTDLSLQEYNPKQIRAMLNYIKKHTKFNSDRKAEQRLIYLMTTFPEEMGIKMKLYLASLEPESFNDVAVL